MSNTNIFDALRKSGHEIPGIDLPGLLDDEQQPAFPRPEKVEAPRLNGNGASNGSNRAAGIAAVIKTAQPQNGHIGLTLKPGAIRTRSIALSTTAPILPFDNQRKTIEQYRMLRTKIQQHTAQPQVLLISSAGSGDGKTTSTINLAGALSLKSHTKVVVVDADFRRPSVRNLLGLTEGPGLVDVCTGACSLEEALIRTEQYPNLYVIGGVECCDNSAELLDSPRWLAVLNELRKEFTYVVLDSPPIGVLADYDLLQASADGIILVIRPDHTRRLQAMKALDTIPKNKFLGVLMNCVDTWFLKKDYYSISQAYYGSPEGAYKK